MATETVQKEQADNNINLVNISRTLLRIVARLPKNEYSEDKSNGHIRRQAEVLKHSDLPDPASDSSTSQG